MRCALYKRISDDPGLEALGVQRQDEDCEALATKNGYTIVARFEDNDLSASKFAKKERPGYKAMLEDAKAGKFEVIVAYSNSRLTRRLIELEDLIQLHEKHGTVINTVVSGQDDLSTADGRMVARIKASVDAAEAERTSERLKRQKQQRAQAGKAHGGRYRVLGYTRDWTVIEDEAKVVREAYERRATGESTTAIAEDFNRRGLTTVAGRKWTSGTLAKTLTKPGYAGLQEHNGAIIGKTSYPAIVDEAVYERVQSNLVKDSKGTNARRHLLSGFLVCSKCLTPMKGNDTNADNPKKRKAYYKCSQSYGGCGSTSIRIQWTDTTVLNQAIQKAQASETDETIAATAERDYDAEVAVIDGKIEELEAAYTSGELSLGDLMRYKGTWRTQRQAVLKEQAEAHVVDMGILQPWYDFDAMNLAQQRVFIGRYIDNVMVYPPATKGRQTPDAARARLEVHYTDGTVSRLTKPVFVGRIET